MARTVQLFTPSGGQVEKFKFDIFFSLYRFLPKFEKKVLSKRKKPLKKKDKKPYTPFPPPMPDSKLDKELESGEYFLKEKEKRLKKQIERKEKQAEAAVKRDEKRQKSFKPPSEENSVKTESKKHELDMDALKAKMDKQAKKKKKIHK